MRRGRGVVAGVLVALAAGLTLPSVSSALEVGQSAPDFTLPAPGGKQIKLADVLGKGPVVIYTFIQAFAGP